MQFKEEEGTLAGSCYVGVGVVAIPAGGVVEGILDIVHKTQHGSLLFAACCMCLLSLLSK